MVHFAMIRFDGASGACQLMPDHFNVPEGHHPKGTTLREAL